jgi:uncharacterized protein (DUF1501 family)
MPNTPLFSRRLFLTRGVQLLSAAGTLPLFLDRSARVLAADFANDPQGAGRPDRVLVIVQMAGGNDGLNTVIPYRNDDYYRARPRLGIKRSDALRANDDFGFHPSATGLKKLYDAGHLAVLHSVGYPNFNRSHFRSTDIWQTAEPEKTARSGWLGRYFDACCSGEDPGPGAKHDGAANKGVKAAEPSAAIALTAEPPTTLIGERFIPIAFRNPAELTHTESARNDKLRRAFDRLNDIDPDHMMDDPDQPHRPAIPLGTNGSVNPAGGSGADPHGGADDFLQRSALNARVYADTIKRSVASVQNKVQYPQSAFATQLKLTAQMIAAGLPTRVYYAQIGGFDTHSGQAARHVRLMEELSEGLASFVEDLKALGQLDRTTVMTFSEFGRRVAENGSGGTDHGEAAPLFVMGTSIQPGFHGTPPELRPDRLHRGDVPFTQDFRDLYATMLRQWLRADDVKVLGKRFDGVDLFDKGKLG